MPAPNEYHSFPTVRPLLYDRFPALRDRVPWLELARGAPTPIAPLARLGARLGLPRLFVKRDDATSPLYGGNKVRKLEWILAEARRKRRRGVITLGAWGSHHALATAIFAREAGLEATLVLYPQPPAAHVRTNLLADLGVGARVALARSIATVPVAIAAEMARAVAGRRGLPFWVAPGGSDARGTLGYVECALEIAAQVAAGAAPAPDFAYVAAGTCGTAAGLALGFALAGLPARVVAVRVVPAAIASARRIERLARRAAALLGVAPLPPFRVDLLGTHLGRGYGLPTEEAREIAAACAAEEGLALETTYTAKTLAGLRAFAAAPERRAAVHLYVHTLNSASVEALAARGDPARLPAALRDA